MVIKDACLLFTVLRFKAQLKGAFHLSDFPAKTIPVATIISLLIKTVLPDQSNPIVCSKEMIFQQKPSEKAYYISN